MDYSIDYHNDGSMERKFPVQPIRNRFIVGIIEKYRSNERRQSIFIGKDPLVLNIHGTNIFFKYQTK